MEELKASPFPFSIQQNKAQMFLSVPSFLHMFDICTPIQLKKNSYFASPFLKLLRLQTYNRRCTMYLPSKTSTGREMLVVYVPTERLQCLGKPQDLLLR